jgi:hypothetical protein
MLGFRPHFFLGAAFFADFFGSGFFAAAFFAAAMWFFTSYRKGLYFLLIYELINILVAKPFSRIELGYKITFVLKLRHDLTKNELYV